MTKANATRGEVTLALEGVDYVLRPSHDAIANIEAETGKGLLRLARESLQGDLNSRETAIVATECIRAQGRAIGDDQMARFAVDSIHALLIEADGGYAKALGTISGLLSGAVTGAYTSAGEIKAATGKVATPAAA